MQGGQPLARHSISCDLRTMRATRLRNASRSSRYSFAASILAGDSSLGLDSIEMMLIMMLCTCVWKWGLKGCYSCGLDSNEMTLITTLCTVGRGGRERE